MSDIHNDDDNPKQKYQIVDISIDFDGLDNINVLNDFLQDINGKLVKLKDKSGNDYYQLYLGEKKQVDNMYEYAFPYLMNKHETNKILSNIINHQLRSSNYLSIITKEKEDEIISHNTLKVFREFDKYRLSIEKFNIYDYLHYIGIMNANIEISDENILELMEIANQVDSSYTDSIDIANALAEIVYVEKYITLDNLKKIPIYEINQLYLQDRLYRIKDYEFNVKSNNHYIDLEQEK